MELHPKTYHYKKAKDGLAKLLKGEGTILVRPVGFTNFSYEGMSAKIWVEKAPPELSKENAIEFFNHGLTKYHTIRREWPELDELLNTNPPKIYLNHDYGGGSISLGTVGEHGKLILCSHFWDQ